MRWFKRLICHWCGHVWVWHELVYEGCWTNDERCARCGIESWWPT